MGLHLDDSEWFKICQRMSGVLATRSWAMREKLSHHEERGRETAEIHKSNVKTSGNYSHTCAGQLSGVGADTMNIQSLMKARVIVVSCR